MSSKQDGAWFKVFFEVTGKASTDVSWLWTRSRMNNENGRRQTSSRFCFAATCRVRAICHEGSSGSCWPASSRNHSRNGVAASARWTPDPSFKRGIWLKGAQDRERSTYKEPSTWPGRAAIAISNYILTLLMHFKKGSGRQANRKYYHCYHYHHHQKLRGRLQISSQNIPCKALTYWTNAIQDVSGEHGEQDWRCLTNFNLLLTLLCHSFLFFFPQNAVIVKSVSWYISHPLRSVSCFFLPAVSRPEALSFPAGWTVFSWQQRSPNRRNQPFGMLAWPFVDLVCFALSLLCFSFLLSLLLHIRSCTQKDQIQTAVLKWRNVTG